MVANHHWNHHRWHATYSLEWTRLSCWYLWNHKGCTYRAPVRYVTKTWECCSIKWKKYIYCYLKCIVCDKLLKPRQSFLITLYYKPYTTCTQSYKKWSRAMVQAVSHQALSAEAQVWTKVVLVRSVIDIVMLEQVSLWVFQLSLVSVIPLMLHTLQSPTIYTLQFGVNVTKLNTDTNTNKNKLHNTGGSPPLSVGNMFQDLPRLRETTDNTECYI